MVTCLLFSYQNLVGIKLTAIEVEPQFSGLDCKFEIRIDKGKSLLHDVSFSFQNTQSTLQSSLQRDKAFLYACTLQRGYFNPGRVTVHSTFPFGLYKVWTHIDFGFNALIFPSPVENESSSMFGKANNESGRFNQTTQGVEQFSSLKSYQLGESLKSVAWKQLAQGRGWLSKQFEQPAGEELLLDIKMLQHLPLESRLSFLCYQVLELDKAKQRYSLKLGAQLIEMNEGTLHKQRCLKALALFDSEYEETTI